MVDLCNACQPSEISDNNKPSFVWHSNFILLMISVKQCERIFTKFHCTISQDELVHLKQFLEGWARIQIDEERNNSLNFLNV